MSPTGDCGASDPIPRYESISATISVGTSFDALWLFISAKCAKCVWAPYVKTRNAVAHITATMSLGRCKACGAEIKEHHYQGRAADEAHSVVYSCNNCPLETSRITFSLPALDDMVTFPRQYLRRLSSVTINSDDRVGELMRVVSVVPTLDHVEHAEDWSANVVMSRSVLKSGRAVPSIGMVSTTGECGSSTIVVRSKFQASSTISIEYLDEYRTGKSENIENVTVDGMVRGVRLPGGYSCAAYDYGSNASPRYELRAVCKAKSTATLRRMILEVMYKQVCFFTMVESLGRSEVQTISNLSPRAWDERRIQKDGHVYTMKIDGERAYLVVWGMIAHLYRRARCPTLIGWFVLSKAVPTARPIVVDVENTVTHGMYLIDMLTDRNGLPSPRTRGYEWVLDEFVAVKALIHPLVVTVRKYFPRLQDAERYSFASTCPTDGVVASHVLDTTARKMKTERAIELMFCESGALVTANGDEVTSLKSVPAAIKPSDIVELRFTLSKSGKSILVTDVFKRPDKDRANDTSAVMSVLRSFPGVQSDVDTRRRMALMWCSTLKSSIIEKACTGDRTRKIVLDVGSGDGQAIDELSRIDWVSYILVEPNKAKCEKLARRVGCKDISTDPRSILSSVRSLKGGSSRYHIVNMELSKVLEDVDVMTALSKEVKAVTSLFSAQYVMGELYDIREKWSIPVYGCAYLYDGVQVGGHLINRLGVMMKRISDTECSVIWGGDSMYKEPYVTSREYETFCNVVRGSSIVDPPSPDADPDVNDICTKVFAMTS